MGVQVQEWKTGVFLLEKEGRRHLAFTPRKAAEILGVSPRTLRYAIRQGSIPAERVRLPGTGSPAWLLTPAGLLTAIRYFGVNPVLVVDRLGNALAWSDEQKLLCLLHWTGIPRDALELFFQTGKVPWPEILNQAKKEVNSDAAPTAMGLRR